MNFKQEQQQEASIMAIMSGACLGSAIGGLWAGLNVFGCVFFIVFFGLVEIVSLSSFSQ